MIDYLLIQDDCAPDSLQHFESELLENHNLTINDFKKNGVTLSKHEDDFIRYEYNGFYLECFSDNPFWHLRLKP